MEKLIEAVVSFLEIMVLGAIAAVFLLYVIAFWHPLKQTLWGYVDQLDRFLFQRDSEKEPGGNTEAEAEYGSKGKLLEALNFRNFLKAVIVFGLVYYAGVLSNVLAYWFVEPAHTQVISRVQPVDNGPYPGRPDDDNSGLAFLGLPFRTSQLVNRAADRADEAEAEKKHSEAIYMEMEWRNKNREAANEQLEPIIKRLRLLRGTVLFAFLFALTGFIKLSVDAGIWVLLWLPGRRFASWAKGRYSAFVDHEFRLFHQAKRKNPRETNVRIMRYVTRHEALRPNFLICVIAAVVYVIAMVAWRCSEIDFHSTVLAGKATAIKVEPRQPDTKPAAGKH